MFDTQQLEQLRELIAEQTQRDRLSLDKLLDELASIRADVRTIKPRSATSVALMAADGGNNWVSFNPFYLQIVRVVDSKGEELCLDVVSPSTNIDELSQRQFHGPNGQPTSLGVLMNDLNVTSLKKLSPMMSGKSASWVLTYRDLCEWATLYDLVCKRNWGSDTLIVHDGLLRAKIFGGTFFTDMYRLIQKRLDEMKREHRRDIWLVGLAKKTQVLEHYRLAMSLSRVFERGKPCFVPVPASMQKEVYRWDEYIRGPEDDDPTKREEPKFNIGSMHFVRFGHRSGDPIWTVDLLDCQKDNAQAIFGYLLADAVAGFPVPFYPNCLQQADSHSRVADLDLSIVEDTLLDAIRREVGRELAPIIDELRMATDVAARRYE